jgi:hypothetical protein
MSGQYQERKEYFKQYREKNKERLQQKRHDYYEESKDRIKEYSKQWKQDNPPPSLNGLSRRRKHIYMLRRRRTHVMTL